MTDKRMGQGPKVMEKSDLTYEKYLRVPELISLQHPESKPEHHDELLFIIIHQAYELWFKQMLHECESIVDYMRSQNVLQANHLAQRVVAILKLGVSQIHVLETMRPVDFLHFRNLLNPASGFQSVQFREFEFFLGLKDEKYLSFFKNQPGCVERLQKRLSGTDLRTEYYKMLSGLGFKMPANPDQNKEQTLEVLKEIYSKPQDHLPLYLMSESLVDIDQYLVLWRQHHVKVVERIIGFKQGTGGSSGVDYLQKTTSKKCFPLLWEVRTLLKIE